MVEYKSFKAEGGTLMLRGKWICAAVALLIALAAAPVAAATGQPPVTVTYYYNNPCGTCNEEGEFIDLFKAKTASLDTGTQPSFLCYNIFRLSDEVKFRDACDALGLTPDQRVTPLLIIGDTVLTGELQIQDGLAEAYRKEAERALARASADDGTASRPVYFYVSPCEECAQVKELLDRLPASLQVRSNGKTFASALILDAHNIATPEGLELARSYFAAYGVPEDRQKVPILFLKDGYLSGAGEIEGGLEEALAQGRAIGIAAPGSAAPMQPYEWSALFLTGLVNGFNPCSLSLLLFLATVLLARNANVLKLGSAFIAGKFMAYLALGTLLFNTLSLLDSSAVRLFGTVVKIVLAVVALAVAAANVNDYLAARSEKYNRIRLQLPTALRRLNHRWLQSLSRVRPGWLVLLTLALGVAISVGEFLCTGQIYLATILYLLRRSPTLNLQTLGAFLVYVVGMLLPLLAATLAIHKGREVFALSELTRRHMPLIKLINAAVFLLFAALLLAFF